MKKNNNKGFTLIELLAVIVILTIILAIAIPGISGIINNSVKSSFKSDAKMVLKAIDYRMLEDENFNPLSITKDNIDDLLKISNSNYTQISISNVNNTMRLIIVGAGKWGGLTAYGTFKTMNVVNSTDYDEVPPVITILGENPINVKSESVYTDAGATADDLKDGATSVEAPVIKNASNQIVASVDTSVVGAVFTITYTSSDSNGNTSTASRTINIIEGDYSASKGVNKPQLVTGMTPIKWNGSIWEDTTTDDIDWYNYTPTDKKWANARTADGSMWVWIPRYAYQIANGFHTNTTGTINVKFLKSLSNIASDESSVALTPEYSGSSQTNYVKHPAFVFGGQEVLGIWIAKFPVSVANISDLCYTDPSIGNCNKSTMQPKLVPGVKAWVCINDDNAFTVLRAIETNSEFGWGTNGTNIDTHLMKNIEWGSAAYLTKSSYGKDTEVVVNTTLPVYTGGGSGTAYSTTTTRSTTGNIYGIYDMSGGAWQKVAAYVNNGKSLGTGEFINAPAKYKDIYQVAGTDTNVNNYAFNSSKFGDAMYETSSSAAESSNSWYGDYSNYPADIYSRIVRSGHGYYMGASAGIFAFQRTSGGDSCTADSFRPTLIVGNGL